MRRVLRGKQLQHPELARPLTWNSLRQIMHREGIGLVVRAITTPARLLGFRGQWTIVVDANQPARRHTYYAAHEVGHAWLHVDDADGRHVCVYNVEAATSADPREDEAETAAAWLLGDRRVRSYLDVPPSIFDAPAEPTLQAAIRDRRVTRAIELLPPPPVPAPPTPAKPPTPERVRVMRTRIDDVDDLDALDRVRREIMIAFARDPWIETLYRKVKRREEELLEEKVFASRRLGSACGRRES